MAESRPMGVSEAGGLDRRRRASSVRHLLVLLGLTSLLSMTFARPLLGQEVAVPRILDQDPERNNLVDPQGHQAAPLGALGEVVKSGKGPVTMILIPGAGFGGSIFQPLVERWDDRYTMYSVTLPGFGGTPAPPTPPEETSFGAQTWTNGALDALQEVLASTGTEPVVVVGHWLVGTQLALRLALDNPDRVAAVVLLAGSAKRPAGKDPATPVPLRTRVEGVDKSLAPKWFRTVTRETWDDNNFLPEEYAAHPVLGLRYWRQAARPPLHVWIRYLCEFLAQDVTLDLHRLKTPTLLLIPDMEGAFVPPSGNYMDAYLNQGWKPVLDSSPALEAQIVPDTRVILWADRPDLIDDLVTRFLDLHLKGQQGDP